MKFEFDKETAVNALLYIAQQVKEPRYHRVVKIIYFADLCHLERYGRMIFGAEYRAYDFGPVPQQIYGMFKAAERKPNGDSTEAPFRVTKRNGYPIVTALSDPNMDLLSESEVECLNEAIKDWGTESFRKTTDASHGTAWESAWQVKEKSIMSVEDIVLSLKDGAHLLQHLQNPHP